VTHEIVIADTAEIDPTAEIGIEMPEYDVDAEHLDMLTIIGHRARVGPHVTIYAGTRLGAYALVGSQSTLGFNVDVGHFATLGEDVVVNDCATIGHHTFVGDMVQISGDVVIGPPAYIGRGSEISTSGRVDHSAYVGENVLVHDFRVPPKWHLRMTPPRRSGLWTTLVAGHPPADNCIRLYAPVLPGWIHPRNLWRFVEGQEYDDPEKPIEFYPMDSIGAWSRLGEPVRFVSALAHLPSVVRSVNYDATAYLVHKFRDVRLYALAS
jgi:carbonic anhydrase/acetyltransferase-like protein (isoleucine patch superfamily)